MAIENHNTSIQERFLGSRDLLALRYKNGLIFLEVEEYEDIKYEEYSGLESIEPGTSLDGGYQRLEDSKNDDILFVPAEDEFTVMHVGIGVSPSVIEMFVSYPEGTRSRKSLPNLSKQPTPGSNFGGTDGSGSPYSQPTNKTELILPPKQRASFNFYNPGDDVHEPLLNIVGRKYKVEVLDPSDNANKNSIKRILNPGSPAPIKAVGNFNQKSGFNLENKWGVSEADKRKARRMVSQNGGRGR